MKTDGPPCVTCTTETCALPCPEMEPEDRGLEARIAAHLEKIQDEADEAESKWRATFATDPYSPFTESCWERWMELRAWHNGARQMAKIILKGE